MKDKVKKTKPVAKSNKIRKSLPKVAPDLYNKVMAYLTEFSDIELQVVKLPQMITSSPRVKLTTVLPANTPAIRFSMDFLLGKAFVALVRDDAGHCYLVEYKMDQPESSYVDAVEEFAYSFEVVAHIKDVNDILATYLYLYKDRSFSEDNEGFTLVGKREVPVETVKKATVHESSDKFYTDYRGDVMKFTQTGDSKQQPHFYQFKPFLKACLEQGLLSIKAKYEVVEKYSISFGTDFD